MEVLEKCSQSHVDEDKGGTSVCVSVCVRANVCV